MSWGIDEHKTHKKTSNKTEIYYIHKNILVQFFSDTEWDKLLKRDVKPIYIPDVSNELDCKYVPKTYLRAEAKDSIVARSAKTDKLDFQEFTYTGDGVMG